MPNREPLTAELAGFVASTQYSDLTETVIECMKKYVLDVLACGFAGVQTRWADIVTEMVQQQGGNPVSSIFRLAERVTASQAALVNGVMIGGFETEHLGHAAHAGGTVPPAAFAVAEELHVTGRELILAMALGYETVCRIGDGQTRAVETERGFHNPAANGPFSAAAAVGKLYGFDAVTQASALGIAGSYCGGLTEYAWKGEMTKRLHPGRASQGGLEAATLAAKGFTGPHTILEGRYGYYNAFSPAPRPELVLAGLGDEWRLETLTIKAYPAHNSCQGLIAAIQGLKREHEIRPDQVQQLHIRSRRDLEPRHLDTTPQTEMGAQYSIPFSLAVAVYRDLDDPAQYDQSVLDDPLIGDLAQRVTWEEIGADGAETDEIDLVLDGKHLTLKAGTFRGSPQNPANFADVADKFRRYSKHVLTAPVQDKIVQKAEQLEQLPDVSELLALIRP